MFKKVLIAEDFDIINLGIEQALRDFGIIDFHHSKYYDDAYLKIQKAIFDNEPYDLLISDLSFKTDHRDIKITTGEELIKKVRLLQPNIKIIAYSILDKSYQIKSLFESNSINSLILKGRNSIGELKKAIQIISASQEIYISPEVASILQNKHDYEIDDLDILILKNLSLGKPQNHITAIFKQLDIKPSSKSTIEKRIAKLKDLFKANNTIHLVSITKDMGII